ncbi:hypothetical protein H4R34_005458 [Dimargaris verticillata]|uniref:Dynactin subunit 4 n=1 Tax=Dimargaris verticillata TaxID=2761393 RepID=A0A9W8AWG9_9FUNG|nr:hypothetical protein H4R34_005458 [Dimargaris verticillata]
MPVLAATAPFVQYHCPCVPLQKPLPADDAEAPHGDSSDCPDNSSTQDERDEVTDPTPAQAPLDPQSMALLHHTHPLCNLYFCDDCLQVRCGRCVFDEITSYFCPNCLFEVPSASVKAEKNRCARNCFECPTCFHSLSVVEDQALITKAKAAQESSSHDDHGDDSASLSSASSTKAAAKGPIKPYYLQCSFCRWNSREIGWTFEKSTGLAGQTQAFESAQQPAKEFDHLRQHFEALMRANSHANATAAVGPGGVGTGLTLGLGLGSSPHASILSSLRQSFALGKATPGSPRTAVGGGLASPSPSLRSVGSLLSPSKDHTNDPPEPYQALHTVPDDPAIVSQLMTLESSDAVSCSSQRQRQPQTPSYLLAQHLPQRVGLRSKRAKRCRECRHILIKPEQKAQATRFKIKLVAMNFIPTITIVRNPTVYKVGRTHPFVLRFTNPQYRETRITLAVPVAYPNKSATITALAPTFKVGAYNDIWEYDPDASADEDPEDLGRSGPADEGIGDDDFDDWLAQIDTTLDYGYGCGPQLVPKYHPARADVTPDKQRRRYRRWLTRGVYERHANETAVILEATPGQPVDNLIVPLLVTFSYHLEPLTDDEGSESESPAKPSPEPHQLERECSFWVYINLGRVVTDV